MPARQTSRSSHHVPRCQVQSLMTMCPRERRATSSAAAIWSIRPDPFRRTASYSPASVKRRRSKPACENAVRSRTLSPEWDQSRPRRLLKSAGTVVRTLRSRRAAFVTIEAARPPERAERLRSGRRASRRGAADIRQRADPVLSHRPTCDGLLVVVPPADIEPEAVVGVGPDRLLSGQQRLYEIREVEVSVSGNEVDDRRLDGVDPHAHERCDLRLLLIRLDSAEAVPDMHHAITDLDRPLHRRHGHGVAVLAVLSQEIAVVKRGKHASVHEDERVVEPLDQSKRGGRAEWALLVNVTDLRAQIGATVEESSDQMRQVAHAEGDVGEAIARELLYDDLEHGSV